MGVVGIVLINVSPSNFFPNTPLPVSFCQICPAALLASGRINRFITICILRVHTWSDILEHDSTGGDIFGKYFKGNFYKQW